jgi:hypothetical protein
MTTFKEIRGTTIEVLSSDPANPETGQIWYNSSSGTLKGYQLANVNAWSSGGNLSNARWSSAATTSGSQTASITFAGFTTVAINATESYNGSAWTAGGNYPVSVRSLMGAGTQTAALAFGGYSDPTGSITTTAKYNGSTWTNAPSGLNTATVDAAGFGLQTAAISAGGNIPSSELSNKTESYNGSAWTNVNNMNTSRRLNRGSGTQTAGLSFGGVISPPNANFTNATESWNGSSWTSVGNMINSLGSRAGIGGPAGQTASIAAGGWTGPASASNAAESWNGSSWTSLSSLATARGAASGDGTSGLGLVSGGNPGNYTNGLTATEEWTGQALLVRTITVS